jgi:DNA-binding CsgD family transcriptional regulator
MIATLVVSESLPSARLLLRHQPLLLARAQFTTLALAPSRAARFAPSGLVLSCTDNVAAWRASVRCAESTPVLFVGADGEAHPKLTCEAEFFATETTLKYEGPKFLAAIDPAIVLVDAILSRNAPARHAGHARIESLERRTRAARQLTDSERDALYLLLSAHSSKEAADRLGISTNSFDKRIAKLHTAFGCSGSHELIVGLFWQSLSGLLSVASQDDW